MLDLSADEVLRTTRAVRRRLDLARPVESALIEECIDLAAQAPSARNRQRWHFVVVTDPRTRAALADLYRAAAPDRGTRPPAPTAADRIEGSGIEDVLASAAYLTDHLHEVPVHVVPCIEGRAEARRTTQEQAAFWGSVIQAVWSFMLAARNRGLGTAWTTAHLYREREAADLLGIPFDEVTQVALIPVAHTLGTDFTSGRRIDLDEIIHWESW